MNYVSLDVATGLNLSATWCADAGGRVYLSASQCDDGSGNLSTVVLWVYDERDFRLFCDKHAIAIQNL